MLKRLLMLVIGAGILFLAITAGLFIFGLLAVAGICAAIYVKLVSMGVINPPRNFRNPADANKPPQQIDAIEGEYEVVEMEPIQQEEEKV